MEVLDAGSFIPFKKNFETIEISLNHKSFSAVVHLNFKEDKDNKKRRYEPNWISKDDACHLELTYINTPIEGEPGGSISPIQIGSIDDKKLYLRVRTFGSKSSNLVIFYTFYLERGK